MSARDRARPVDPFRITDWPDAADTAGWRFETRDGEVGKERRAGIGHTLETAEIPVVLAHHSPRR